MSILLLGATGAMGQAAARFLAAEDVPFTLAGRDREKLSRLRAKLGKGETAVVALEDEQALRQAMRNHRVVAGAAGPFYRWEGYLGRLALEEGVHYISICDDYDGAQALLDLHEEARAKGLTLITGMGWTPGLTNLAALLGAQELDHVRAIHAAWAGSAEDDSGLAVTLHVLHAFAGKVPSYRGGQLVQVQAGKGPYWVDFPSPLGPVPTYECGHPEPITLSRSFPGVEEVTLRGAITQKLPNAIGRLLGRFSFLHGAKVRPKVAALSMRLLPLLNRLTPAPTSLSGFWVRVEGMKEGKPWQVTRRALGPMDVLTGFPLAVGAADLSQGKVGIPGAYPPEAPGLFMPADIFQRLEAFAVKVERLEGPLTG
ncbi:MAG: saccharopine dehydrogenase NADP-binding domain-containing protein [Bacillota bacterium]|nr:saccharopine dehydrogenase NADP-binding domain-containing protein [Bacillota bacterium]